MNEQRKNFLLALYISLPILIGIESNVIDLLELKKLREITSYINPLLIAAIILSFLYFNRGLLKKRLLIVLSVYSLLILITFFLHNELLIIADKLVYYTFIQVIMYIMFFSAMKDLKPLTKYLRIYFIFGTIYSITQIFIFNITKLYSMGYSYNMTVLIIISLILAITKKRVDCMLFFLFNFGVILIVGSRGIILCILISLMLMPLFYKIKRKNLLILTSIVAVLLIAVLIMGFAFNNVIKSSRNMKALKEDAINVYNSLSGKGELKIRLSGREKYYGFILNKIAERPFSYKGIYSDRYYLAHHFGKSGEPIMFGYYPHNIVLEILFQFGVLLGAMILLYFAYIIFNTGFKINKSKNRLYIILYIAILSYSVGQLMISGSYLTSNSFGLLVGYIIFIQSKKISNGQYNEL